MTVATTISNGNGVVNGNTNFFRNGTKYNPRTTILHRHIHHKPNNVVLASGNYIHLDDGRKIFDATGGAAVSVIGHGSVRVMDAIRKQEQEVSYCHSMFFGTAVAESLGRALIDSTGGKMGRVFIVSSGEPPQSRLGHSADNM